MPVPDALATVGRALAADRVYLFENIRDADGRLWMNLTSEWVETASEGSRRPRTTLHPYSPDFVRWIEVLGDLGSSAARWPIPGDGAADLSAEGTLSLVAVPIAVADGWWGFLGADDCDGAREWSAGETDLLQAVAAAHRGRIQRQRQVSASEIVGDRYRAIVEHIPAVTYIDAVDDAASTMYISPQVEALLGYSPDEWIAIRPVAEGLHPDDRTRASPRTTVTTRLASPSRWSTASSQGRKSSGSTTRRGWSVTTGVSRLLARHDDRRHGDEARRREGRIPDLSRRADRIATRAMFEELLDLSIDRAKRHDVAVAVLCVDIDDFRLVNDSLGRTRATSS